jgi:hypothetical protein
MLAQHEQQTPWRIIDDIGMALERRRAASLTVVFSVIAILIAVPGLNGQTSSSSRPLSATVVGSYVVRNGELTLIVLWRGSPGGGKSFSIDFDYTAGGARLLEQAIRLSETNVVLVDDVDSVSGARIVGRQWVDPKLPERPALDPSASVADQSLAMMASDPILVAIRRDPGLGAYLQCDVPVPVPDGLDASVPDPPARARLVEYMQQMLAMLCWQAVGP